MSARLIGLAQRLRDTPYDHSLLREIEGLSPDELFILMEDILWVLANYTNSDEDEVIDSLREIVKEMYQLVYSRLVSEKDLDFFELIELIVEIFDYSIEFCDESCAPEKDLKLPVLVSV